MSNNTKRTALRILIPFIVLALGIAGAVTLSKRKKPPGRTSSKNLGVLVEVTPAAAGKRVLDVAAKGEVTSSRTVVLQPRVVGEVVWISDKLVVGGLVKKGEPLIKVERTDYQIAVDQQKTSVAQAEAQIRLEEGQQEVAKQEWELFSKDDDADKDPSLALRQPQKKIAEVKLDAAKAMLKKAKLDLRRTTVVAPFNAFVRSENVEVGQFVSSASQMAQLVGTDEFLVQVSLPLDRLGLIDVPGVNSTTGATAKITQAIGESPIERDGEVLRLLGDLDPAGRMARLIVSVQDPLGLKKEPSERGLPLLIGAFVAVNISGGASESVVALPRTSIHEGDLLHVYKDGALEVRDVTIVWGDENEVLVRGGIEPGETYVTSKIGTPIPGMKLRTADSKKPESAERAEVAK